MFIFNFVQSWSDFKQSTKSKVKKIRQHRNGTGGGPACNVVLTDFEESIVGIIGEFVADGDPDLDEIGFSDDGKYNSSCFSQLI